MHPGLYSCHGNGRTDDLASDAQDIGIVMLSFPCRMFRPASRYVSVMVPIQKVLTDIQIEYFHISNVSNRECNLLFLLRLNLPGPLEALLCHDHRDNLIDNGSGCDGS